MDRGMEDRRSGRRKPGVRPRCRPRFFRCDICDSFRRVRGPRARKEPQRWAVGFAAAWLIPTLVLRAGSVQAQPSAAPSPGPDARGGEVSPGPDAQNAEVPPPPLADATRAAVRKLADAGVAAYRAGDLEGASEKLEKAYQLMPVPSLALWSARALMGRGAWTRAAERYLSARRLALGPGDPRIQEQAQQVAAVERAALVPRIPSLRVHVEGAAAGEVSVTVDGTALPPLLVGEDWPVNPGTHDIVGVRGSERVEATASVGEGQHAEVSLRFVAALSVAPGNVSGAPSASVVVAPSSASILALEGAPVETKSEHDRAASASDTPGSAWQTAGWVTLGVGGATLLTSGVLGLVAQQKHRELTSSEACLGNSCLESDEVETYNSLVDLSTVGWISGAVLLGAGAVLVLTVPGSDGATRVAVTPSTVGIVGQF